MSGDGPFDPGLQLERTFLAWQRTVLALGVACAVAVRFTVPQFGAPAFIAGVAGLGLAVAAYVGARYRYRRAHTGLTLFATLHSVSAWPLAALAASMFLLGLLAVGFLLVGVRLTL